MEPILEQMRQDLARAGYVQSTQEHYLKTAKALQSHYGRPLGELGREELRGFVALLETQAKSASWMKMRLAALAFLYRKTLGRPNEVSFISFPRQRSPLPTVE